MQEPRARALILVPDDRRRRRVRAALERDGHEVLSTGSGRRAAELLKDWRHAPDVVVLDMGLPTADGAAFADAYRRAPGQHPPIILVPAPEQTDHPVRRQFAEEDVTGLADALEDLGEAGEDGLSSAALDLLRARVRVHGSELAAQRRSRHRRPTSVIAAALARVGQTSYVVQAHAWRR